MEERRANRKFLEKELATALRPSKSNFVAVCDARTARVRKLIDVPQPRALRAVG